MLFYLIVDKKLFKKTLKQRNYNYNLCFEEKEIINYFFEDSIALEVEYVEDIEVFNSKDFIHNLRFTGNICIEFEKYISKINIDVDIHDEVFQLEKVIKVIN